jgi:serine/threonine-protein kinase
MRAHLQRTRRSARPYQRYFTFAHLHNNPKVTSNDLRLYHAALAKLLNSLSWKRAVVVPQPIDEQQTMLAVDIRKLDWDRHGLWSEILKVYPYGLAHHRYPDGEASREAAREVYELAGTEVPAVRADWFLATASRPPLYHTLLQVPRNAQKLEALLRVDVRANFQRNELARAGFTNSGVSRQNRLVERHEAAHGAYWKSYDFKSNDGTSSLFRFPLGPRFLGNPFTEQGFEHAGGEIIFSLPNGLQGYLLVNNQDERIDEGPTDIVRDKTETSGSVAIVNGLSCMSCHQHGPVKDFKDGVRTGHSLAGDPGEKVRELYPEAAVMAKWLEEDERRFLRALDRATGLFLKVGPDQSKDIRDFPEVIGPPARSYLLKEVGPEEAARELGLKDPTTLQGAVRANRRLRAIGLLPLARGGSVKREVWESVRGLISPFQEAALALELGTPRREH